MELDMSKLREINDLLEEKSQTFLVKKQSILDREKSRESLEKRIANVLAAQKIAQSVAEETQQNLGSHLSNIVTKAFQAIFDDPYEFGVRFESKNNKTACRLFFTKNGKEVNPFFSSGGGAIDVASFALRQAVWAIQPNRPVFILDEPFHFLSRDLQHKAGALLKMFSESFGVQIIIISHVQEIIDSADKVFEVTNVNGDAVVTEV